MRQFTSRQHRVYLAALLGLVMFSSTAVSQTSEPVPREEVRIETSEQERSGANRGAERRPKPILQARVSADRIEPGESIQLDWRARFSPKGVLLLPDGRKMKKRGSMSISPASTTEYTLVAENRWGRASQSFLVVVENPQPDVTAPTQPEISNIISAGTEVQLDWQPSSDDYTPGAELIYRIYISEAGAGGEAGGFQLAGELTGETAFSLETLQPNTSFYLTVVAIDSAGNESARSEPVDVETGSHNLVLKQGITVVDLREKALQIDLDLPDFLRIAPGSDTPGIETGDVLFVADNASEYTLRVQKISVGLDGALELRVEEISPFELIEEGDIKIKSNFDGGGANLDGERDEGGESVSARTGWTPILTQSNRGSNRTSRLCCNFGKK